MWSESERIPLIDKAAQRRTGAVTTALFRPGSGWGMRTVGKHVKGVEFKAAISQRGYGDPLDIHYFL